METPGLTIRETAALSGVASTVVEKAVQSGIIVPRAAPALFPGGSTRYLPARAVVYFHALKAADLTDLPRRHKRAIWSRITGMEPMRLGPVEFAPGATLDLNLALSQFGIANGYREARDRYIKSDPEILGGTPVIDGTRIPVYAVLGRLRHGDTLEDLLDDYPHVPRAAFRAAEIYAAAHPLRGRPSGRPWHRMD